ncbi:ATPase [Sporosarcina sp. Sa2YVA2]|uniref:ATPase n=1 Tax=Sporosarcina quadrami TaxID=2762234 RepID=A0ABR8U710_9BACL|nr:ATPase [Sporosarcina quadrami]MBD7983825.1 ATPase [Sporosarcina quadrami]
MSDKASKIAFLAAFGTMTILYLIGELFDVPFLYFKILQNKPVGNGAMQVTEIALLPIAIGVVIGFVVEYLLKRKNR